MVEINFPADPSKLRFFLDRSISSTYLVARAAKHYGPRNIDVTFIAPTTEAVESDERNRSIHKIISDIGIADARLVGYNHFTQGITLAQSTETFISLLKRVDPTYVPVTELIHKDVAAYAITACMVMGWINPDLTLADHFDTTYVSFVDRSTQATKHFMDLYDIVSRPDVADKVSVWSPLASYTDLQILESAIEEGLIDIIKQTRSCEHSRPLHCGVCNPCMERRLLFLEAGVEDDTIYECGS